MLNKSAMPSIAPNLLGKGIKDSNFSSFCCRLVHIFGWLGWVGGLVY